MRLQRNEYLLFLANFLINNHILWHVFSIFVHKDNEIMGKNIAILASGNGTNAENIIQHFGTTEHRVKLVLTNSQKAFALERARKLGVKCAYFSKDFWADGNSILSVLQTEGIDFIVLAGFLSRVPDNILRAYPRRIVNIHPSLLPKFGGKGMYGDMVHQAVLASGDKESGITIHYTNEHYDEGQIIAQYSCAVNPDDTFITLANRVHTLEYEYYPKVIEKLLNELG